MGARNTITAALLPIHFITDDEIDGGTQDTAFDANPQLYNSDLAKITFALSYLKDLALAYFQPFMGKPLDERPEWYVNYESFLAQLRDNHECACAPCNVPL